MTFGCEGRFCTDTRPPPPQIKDAQLNREEWLIRGLLQNLDEKLPERVERSYKQWNLIVRDYLRNETALRLTVGDDHQAVPVKVCDGLPRPLWELVRQFPDRELWELLLNRGRIGDAVTGLDVLRRSHGYLVDSGFLDAAAEQAQKQNRPVPKFPSADELDRCMDFAAFVARALEEFQLLERLKEVNEDVLGAYFFNVPEVRLYWMAIGLVAGMIGVSAESLTVVVLAHELAHAYTHLGSDIDGQKWGTRQFAATDVHVVEGLAQFYTQTICSKMLQRYPAPKEAFDLLIARQSPPYSDYRKWLEGMEEGRKGEAFRFAMIQERSIGRGDVAGFKGELEKAKAPPGKAGQQTEEGGQEH